MNVDHDGARWVAHVTYEQHMVVKNAGFHWDPAVRRWVTKTPQAARRLYDFMTPRARQAMAQVDAQAEQMLLQSKALSSRSEHPCPPGVALMPFQAAGVDYALQRDTLIADPPGLGKSAQAIVIAGVLQARRVLIIAPASLKINWQREWAKFSTLDLTVGIVSTTKVLVDGKATTQDVWPDTDVVIVNHEMLKRHLDKVHEIAWDILIVDEAHYLSSPTSQRTLQILGGSTGRGKKKVTWKSIKAKRRLFLTGTPMLSRPIELWPIIQALDPKGLGRNWQTYVYRYCGAFTAPFGLDVSGSSNLSELQGKLRMAFMVRRSKEEALRDLPPKRRQIIELPADGLDKAVEAETSAFASALKEYEAMLQGVQDSSPQKAWTSLLDEMQRRWGHLATLDYEARAERLDDPESAAFEELSRARRNLAIAKVPMVAEFVGNHLKAGEKVILFVYHTEVAEKLREAFPGCAYITGKVAPSKRQAEVDRFQTDPNCLLMIGNITAAGVGLTMTASSLVVFAELAWTPAQMEQAEDRAWRHGQTNAVLVQHLVVEGSMDARMIHTLLEKQKAIAEALDAKVPERLTFA